MSDAENDVVPMPHDGYRKLFQLFEPTLLYDIVLFDEAQDAHAAITDLILRQAVRKVFVGEATSPEILPMRQMAL